MSIEQYRTKYGAFQPFEHLELRTLPRLPIPELRATLLKYLEWVRPLVAPDAFARTETIVRDFLASPESASLYRELESLASQSPTSWLEGFWDTWYLEPRCPLPVHVNPVFVFPYEPRLPHLALGAHFLHHLAAIYASIASNTFAPDREGSTPLCMTQYGRALATWRVPHSPRDEIFTTTAPRHALLRIRGHFFAVDVLDATRAPLSIAALHAALSAAWAAAPARAELDIGLLTTATRGAWASARAALLAGGAGAALEAIDTALVVLCLDDADAKGLEGAARAGLYGDGRNRWFDKLQFIISRDGYAAINMEHAPYDGHTTLRIATDLHARVARRGEEPAGAPAAPWRRLSLCPMPARAAIVAAEGEYRALTRALDMAVSTRPGVGKAFAVRHGMSPDALVQVAFQIAYFRLRGRVDSTYESTLTKAFFHGRTECTRSVTCESRRIASTFFGDKADEAAKIAGVRAAVAAHAKRTKECKSAQGVDRLLFGLWNLARQRQQRQPGYRMPQIFEDSSYAKESTSVLSTSNCGGNALVLFAFGPVCDNGLGLGYMIHPDAVHLCVTSWTGEAEKFKQCFEEVLAAFEKLFAGKENVRAKV